ncbi:hypothetical protein [Halorussus marinus]|uniref:hypothetical protein n=1 Tax=Halorussus marinus TaxID=2505976 RepID=UPI00106E0B5C|nr:hypothetical protein [Halorussus marinus]
MPSATGERLAGYATDQLGDALRTVFVLFEDDWKPIYIRDDIRQTYTEDRYERVAESFRIDFEAGVHERPETEIGSKAAIVHYHDNAYVFQFPHEQCHSVLLSVEPEVGSKLSSFIDGCRDRL